MIDALYMKTLVARQMNDAAERAGLRVSRIDLRNSASYSASVHNSEVQVQIGGDGGGADAARKMLATWPELQVDSSSGLLFLVGTSHGGITFCYYFGQGRTEDVLGAAS